MKPEKPQLPRPNLDENSIRVLFAHTHKLVQVLQACVIVHRRSCVRRQYVVQKMNTHTQMYVYMQMCT